MTERLTLKSIEGKLEAIRRWHFGESWDDRQDDHRLDNWLHFEPLQSGTLSKRYRIMPAAPSDPLKEQTVEVRFIFHGDTDPSSQKVLEFKRLFKLPWTLYSGTITPIRTRAIMRVAGMYRQQCISTHDWYCAACQAPRVEGRRTQDTFNLAEGGSELGAEQGRFTQHVFPVCSGPGSACHAVIEKANESLSQDWTPAHENCTCGECKVLIQQRCDYCLKTSHDRKAELKKCSRCKKVAYCGPECQKAHWIASHKQDCQAEMVPKGKATWPPPIRKLGAQEKQFRKKIESAAKTMPTMAAAVLEQANIGSFRSSYMQNQDPRVEREIQQHEALLSTLVPQLDHLYE